MKSRDDLSGLTGKSPTGTRGLFRVPLGANAPFLLRSGFDEPCPSAPSSTPWRASSVISRLSDVDASGSAFRIEWRGGSRGSCCGGSSDKRFVHLPNRNRVLPFLSKSENGPKRLLSPFLKCWTSPQSYSGYYDHNQSLVFIEPHLDDPIHFHSDAFYHVRKYGRRSLSPHLRRCLHLGRRYHTWIGFS